MAEQHSNSERNSFSTAGRQVLPNLLEHGLLEQLFEIFQVVTGYQDGLALFGPQRHLGRHGMPVGTGVAGIEQFHGPDVDFTDSQGTGDQVVDAEILADVYLAMTGGQTALSLDADAGSDTQNESASGVRQIRWTASVT